MTLFGESPKSDMSGSNVTYAYYENNLDMVKRYCEGDVKFTARCYEAISNPQPKGQDTVNTESIDSVPLQEGMVNNPNKPEFTPADLLKQKSRGKEIVEKFEMAEVYVDDLEHHFAISDELKSQLYSIWENEKKKHEPIVVGDDAFPF
jgi:hypothetical protein